MTTTADIADASTHQRIAVCASGYPDDALDPRLAGRAVVTIKTASILTPDDLVDDTDDVDLTIEMAVRLARKLLMAAGNAMHHDPGPWRFKRTDMDVLQAAVDAHNADVSSDSREQR